MRSCQTRRRRVIGLEQPQAQPVTGRVGQVLLDPEVAVGGPDRGAAQAKLDLVEPNAAF